MGEFSKPHKKTAASSSFFTDTLPAGNQRPIPRTELRSIRNRKKHCLLLNASLSLAVVLLAFWENYEYHLVGDKDSSLVIALRTLLLSLTGLQLTVLAQTYCLHSKEVHAEDVGGSLRAWAAVEAALTCPVPLPCYDFSVQVTQLGTTMNLTLDDILMPLVCLRLVHAIKCVQFVSFLSHPRGYCYFALHAIPSRTVFLLKGMLASKLFTLMTLVILANMCLSGLLLRVFEQNVPNRPEMAYIWNGFWLVEVSNQTIGYGDLVPLTHIGRGIIVLSILVGIGTLSFVMLWAGLQLTLENQELRTFAAIVSKKIASERLQLNAAILLQRKWRLALKRKHAQPRLRETFEFNFQLTKFRFERNLCKATNEPTLKDQVYYFDSDTRPRFAAVTAFLPAVRQYEDVVSVSQSQRFSAKVASQVKIVTAVQKRFLCMRRILRGITGSEGSEIAGEELDAALLCSPRRRSVLMNRRVTLKLGSVNAFKNMKKRFLNKKFSMSAAPAGCESSSDLLSVVEE